jgi:hypothetical protein
MVKSKSSLWPPPPDRGHEYTLAVSDFDVSETSSSFGAGVVAFVVAMWWRLQKSLEEKSAAQERQTARKRRMDLTGSRGSTSNMMSSASTTARVRPGTVVDGLLLLLLRDEASVVTGGGGMFTAAARDGVALNSVLVMRWPMGEFIIETASNENNAREQENLGFPYTKRKAGMRARICDTEVAFLRFFFFERKTCCDYIDQPAHSDAKSSSTTKSGGGQPGITQSL